MPKKILLALSIIISLSLLTSVIIKNLSSLNSALAADETTPSTSETPTAAPPSSDTSADAEQVIQKCTTEMRKFIPTQEQEFLTYLQETFKGEDPNSGKVNEAVDKFNEIKNKISAKYTELIQTSAPSKELLETTAMGSNCKILVDNEFIALGEVLKSHALKTTSSKTTTQLLEKYKAINKQLKDMNQNFGRLKGYIDSFNAKMPCYIKK
jgi:hypothetical protein